MRKLLILPCLFLTVIISAQKDFQPGWVIALIGDTIHGLVANNSFEVNAEKCEFKTDADAITQVFLPGQISSYRFTDGKYYVSDTIWHNHGKQVVFLEYIIKGTLNVYLLRIDNHDLYYAQKEGNDSLFYLENSDIYYEFDEVKREYYVSETKTYQKMRESNKYKGILNYLTIEVPSMQKDIQRLSLNRKNLTGLAREYHNAVCDSAACIVYEKEIHPKVYLFYLPSYLNYRHPDLHNNSFGSFSESVFSPISFSVMYQLTGWNEKLYFNPQIGFYELNSTLKENNYYHTLSASTIEASFNFAYILRGKIIHPYIMAGVSVQYLAGVKYTEKYSPGPDDWTTVDRENIGKDYKYPQPGVTGGIGLVAEINRFCLNAGAAYIYYPMLPGTQTISVQLGIGIIINK